MSFSSPNNWFVIVGLLLLPRGVSAEIYFPPRHVVDPSQPSKPGEADTSVPFIYLEPYNCCFEITQPLPVTIYAVNRSGKPAQIDWRSIIQALTFEGIGRGRAAPKSNLPQFKVVEVQETSFGSLTLDLKEHFEIHGASVYRLSYVRLLEDGRVHIAKPATFVVEDKTEIEKLTLGLDLGTRESVSEMLISNPLFVGRAEPKTYGWDAQQWSDRQMHQHRMDEPLGRATERWNSGIARLVVKDASAPHVLAIETLLDRILLLSDQLRVPLDSQAYYQVMRPVNDNFKPDDRERIHVKLAQSRDSWVVSQSISGLVELESITRHLVPSKVSPSVLDAVFSIADGPDIDLARKAISSFSSYRPDSRITQFLRRKMTDGNGKLALQAAIVSCYTGDWSGLPVLLRYARSKDPALRLAAIAQLGDHQFRPYSAKVVPLLLAELKEPLSDAHLERAVESLATYPNAEVADAIAPLLEHQNEQIRRRAQHSSEMIKRGR